MNTVRTGNEPTVIDDHSLGIVIEPLAKASLDIVRILFEPQPSTATEILRESTVGCNWNAGLIE